MPRGGARPGAGRPISSPRRIEIDADHAQLLRDIVRRWRARSPQGRYTARHVIEDLIVAEALRERDEVSRQS